MQQCVYLCLQNIAMSLFILENEYLTVSISDNGAELQNIYNKQTQLEYLWSGDAAFWGKKSPVLFPIVGGLKNGEYLYSNKTHKLSRHGFARDNVFSANQLSSTCIEFTLASNETTLAVFPFPFLFTLRYTISGNKLTCKYIVKNTGNETMFFSVGAHPAFKIPLTTNTHFNDWYLEFNKEENCGIYPLTADGLLKSGTMHFFNETNKLALTKEIFYKDALVFKELQSTAISIKSEKSANGLTMQFDGFPFYGIWSAKDANFVCLEPWCGIADSENTNQDFTQKEGIIQLEASNSFEREWSVEMF